MSGSGKSAITRRCCGLAFDERYDPTTITIQRRTFRIEDAAFNVDIVDTAGQVCGQGVCVGRG
jgi:GTPase SAR1 family protein